MKKNYIPTFEEYQTSLTEALFNPAKYDAMTQLKKWKASTDYTGSGDDAGEYKNLLKMIKQGKEEEALKRIFQSDQFSNDPWFNENVNVNEKADHVEQYNKVRDTINSVQDKKHLPAAQALLMNLVDSWSTKVKGMGTVSSIKFQEVSDVSTRVKELQAMLDTKKKQLKS